MKKTISIFAIIGMFSFVADKYVSLKFTETQINFHWQNLNQIKAIIDQSNLPHNQVQYIIKSIDSLQHDIQLSVKQDSINKK